MSVNLDKINYQKSDSNSMLSHLEKFPLLCKEAWNLSQDITIPAYYIKAKKFVLLGMGGSGIAGDIVSDLLRKTKVVVHVSHDYDLPGWVDDETIVVANSYSGDTEEVLNAFIEAHNLNAKLIAITTGGKLKILSEKYKAVCMNFSYECKPRAAFPFLFIYLLSIFIKLGQVELDSSDFSKSIEFLDSELQKFKSNSNLSLNPAKNLAQKIHGKTVITYGSGMLTSVSKRYKAQFNENAKYFAFSDQFPELNHNSIEGLSYPNKEFIILMLESNYDNQRNIKRQNITSELLRKNKISCERIKFVPCESQLAEILTMVLFGDFISYYLALLYKADTNSNDNISYLKSQL